MAKRSKVERPTKRNEYEIRYASRDAEKGWRDLVSTIRGPMADAWDFLTRTPLAKTPTNLPLKGQLGKITRDGRQHDRWQHKPTAKGDARIGFWVNGQTVYLEQVHTRHPNQTK